MSKVKRGLAALATMALVGGVGLAVAAPAMAANHCSSGNVCLYDYDDYTGLIATRGGGSATRIAVKYSDGRLAGDKTAAWGNDSIYDGGLWDEASTSSACWTAYAKSSGSMGITTRDRVEYWRTANGC